MNAFKGLGSGIDHPLMVFGFTRQQRFLIKSLHGYSPLNGRTQTADGQLPAWTLAKESLEFVRQHPVGPTSAPNKGMVDKVVTHLARLGRI